jgi:hypothetical protein
MRKLWGIASGLTLALLAIPCAPVARSQDFASSNEAERMLELNMVQLEDQLVNGLRLTNREQRLFIRRVIHEVEQGRLPRSLVNVVFVWAKEKNAKYPFPYFQIAVRILAARRGVDLS